MVKLKTLEDVPEFVTSVFTIKMELVSSEDVQVVSKTMDLVAASAHQFQPVDAIRQPSD